MLTRIHLFDVYCRALVTLFLITVPSPVGGPPRMTRSNSIPTHDASMELYGASPLGSTVSLAERPRSMGMVRSGSFRDRESNEDGDFFWTFLSSDKWDLFDFISTLMDLFFFVCVLLLFMLSSWLCTLLGLQLIKLLFGEFGQHADSGSYSSAYAVCVDVCWCNDAFLLFHALNTWNCSLYLIRPHSSRLCLC